MKKRIMAAILAACMLVGATGLEAAAAGKTTAVLEAQETKAEKGQTKAETRQRALKKQKVQKGTVDYVYLAQEKVPLTGTQQLLIGIGEEAGELQEAELFYHKKEDGTEYRLSAKEISGQALLFQKKYTKGSQKGSYILDKVTYVTKAGQVYEAKLGAEKEIKYGVGKEVKANPDAYIYEDTTKVDVEVISMESGARERLAGAQHAGVLTAGAAARSARARSVRAAQDMVIVLDPGHGGSDPGAVRTYNGVTYYERNIVLKIAEYCKQELEKYSGVEVYLTRTDNTSPLMNRLERTQFALSKGADVIVSLHINSTGESFSSVNGSMVYCPNTDTESGKVSQELANVILKKLAELGLKNRGVLVDEGLGMIKYPKENGVPGILIEHAFINNASDVSKYLSSDAKLKKLGIADASAIAEYFKLEEKGSQYEKYKKNSGKISLKKSSDGTKYTFTIGKVPKAYAVKCRVWNEADGTKGAKWYKAKLSKSGVWKGSFQIADFKKKGTYQIQAYVINEDKTKTPVAKMSQKVNAPTAKKITVEQVKPEKGTFRVRITGLTSDASIEKVRIKVWSQEDKKDSYTYTAKLQKNGSYLANMNIKRHKYNYGNYQIYVYATDKNGLTRKFKRRTLQLERPSLHTKIKANSRQTTYTLSLDKTLDIQRVRMAVWSKSGGQNDLRWYNAELTDENHFSTTVNISRHKSAGTYYADIYGLTKAGQEVLLESKTFRVAAPGVKEITVKKKNYAAGTFYVYINGVTAKAGIKSVTMKAWSQEDRKDLHTYTAKELSDGRYRIKVDKRNHNNNEGTYTLKVYIRDKRGVTKTKTIKQDFFLQ